MTIKEAATLSHRTEGYIRKLIKSKKSPFKVVKKKLPTGGFYYDIDAGDVKKYIKSPPKRGPAYRQKEADED